MHVYYVLHIVYKMMYIGIIITYTYNHTSSGSQKPTFAMKKKKLIWASISSFLSNQCIKPFVIKVKLSQKYEVSQWTLFFFIIHCYFQCYKATF